MAEMGERYPSFVVPLPREVVEHKANGEEKENDGLPEQKDAKSIGAEMQFLVSAKANRLVSPENPADVYVPSTYSHGSNGLSTPNLPSLVFHQPLQFSTPH